MLSSRVNDKKQKKGARALAGVTVHCPQEEEKDGDRDDTAHARSTRLIEPAHLIPARPGPAARRAGPQGAGDSMGSQAAGGTVCSSIREGAAPVLHSRV